MRGCEIRQVRSELRGFEVSETATVGRVLSVPRPLGSVGPKIGSRVDLQHKRFTITCSLHLHHYLKG
jgi:hypothetical protein